MMAGHPIFEVYPTDFEQSCTSGLLHSLLGFLEALGNTDIKSLLVFRLNTAHNTLNKILTAHKGEFVIVDGYFSSRTCKYPL